MARTDRLTTAPARSPFTMNPGEHAVCTGINGCGKSTLMERLLDPRRYLIVFRTKPDDCKYRVDRMTKTGPETVAAMRDPRVNRIELAPPRDAQAQPIYDTVREALNVGDKRAAAGGWTLLGDEGYRIKQLGLMDLWEEGYTQGRSMHLTMVTCVQRPVFVSRFVFSESRHIISFPAEGRDLLTLRDGVGRTHADAVEQLGPWQCAWTYRQPGGRTQTVVTSLEDMQRG